MWHMKIAFLFLFSLFFLQGEFAKKNALVCFCTSNRPLELDRNWVIVSLERTIDEILKGGNWRCMDNSSSLEENTPSHTRWISLWGFQFLSVANRSEADANGASGQGYAGTSYPQHCFVIVITESLCQLCIPSVSGCI